MHRLWSEDRLTDESDCPHRHSCPIATYRILFIMAIYFRSAMRSTLPLRSISQSVQSRGFADKMSFTFASPYEVTLLAFFFVQSLTLFLFVNDQVFYNNADVKQVDVPSYSGNFGILANHVPSLAVLKPGVVSVFENDGNTKKYFVSSGTIAINDDSSVQVLAEEAVPVEWLDAAAARKILSDAQANAGKGGTEQEKAEAQIAVEVGEALVKAIE